MSGITPATVSCRMRPLESGENPSPASSFVSASGPFLHPKYQLCRDVYEVVPSISRLKIGTNTGHASNASRSPLRGEDQSPHLRSIRPIGTILPDDSHGHPSQCNDIPTLVLSSRIFLLHLHSYHHGTKSTFCPRGRG